MQLPIQIVRNNKDVTAQQTTTILQYEYGNFKEVKQQLEVVTS